MYGQSLAHVEIEEPVAEAMAAKVREAIALGHEAGYDGGSIGDLLHGISYLYAWEEPDNATNQKEKEQEK